MARYSTSVLLLSLLSSWTFTNAFQPNNPSRVFASRSTQRVNNGISSNARTGTPLKMSAASDSLEAIYSSLSSKVAPIPIENTNIRVDSVVDTVQQQGIPFMNQLELSSAVTAITDFVQQQVMPVVNALNLSPPVMAIGTTAITFSIVSALLSINKPPSPALPYPLSKYDAAAARAYFDERPGEVLVRATKVALMSAGFGLGLLGDFLSNKMKENQDIRARELTKLLTVLGPSFIKIGQSLSIRTDLLSPAYQRGLKSLQDQVPPFDTQEARRMIEDELGQSVDAIFSDFSVEPVAAASLGQVYRATVRSTGTDVAIKVQRPNIMNQIALDMYLIREVAPILKSTFNLNTDLADIIDVWGAGFVDELDYLSEAENADVFMESMQATPLSGVVFAPNPVKEYSTEKVLVTEWVDGERLDKSAKEDVTVLCSIAMNTYLTMMLETGVLHCDPHPGNLLRTPDGRLCILDWGMVTKLSPNLQVSLIEHMAHLTSADYEEIPGDLLELGFIPKSKADLIDDSGVVDLLADIYGAWTSGGGAASINVNKVISQLQDLTAEKGNLFQIPAYFAYIAKSFSVLEGIGLSNDAKYSIINECLPYVSKRLLTDANPRTGGALNTFIFGPNKNSPDRIIDYDRVEQLIEGFGEYSTSASGEMLVKNRDGEGLSKAELIDAQANQILDLLITEEETPLQGIMVEQLAKIISSSSRNAWGTLREASGKLPSGRSVLGTIVDPLGFWRSSPLVQVSELDQKTIETTRNLIELFQKQSEKSPIFDAATLSNEDVFEISRALVQNLWGKRSGVLKTGGRLTKELLELTADRLEKGERERPQTPPTDAVTVDENKEKNYMTIPSDSQLEMNHSESSGSVPSRRLAGAQDLLAELESGEKV